MQDSEVLERLLASKRSAAEDSQPTWQENNGLDVEQLKIGITILLLTIDMTLIAM